MEPHVWIDGFWSSAYAPHGYCLLWEPELVWSHVVADTIIAAAYFSIPVVLWRLLRMRRDIVSAGLSKYNLPPGETGTVTTIFGHSYGKKPGYKLDPKAVARILLWNPVDTLDGPAQGTPPAPCRTRCPRSRRRSELRAPLPTIGPTTPRPRARAPAPGRT